MVPVGFCISDAKSFSETGSHSWWGTTKQLYETLLLNSYCTDDSSSELCDNNGCATNLSISRCAQTKILNLNDHSSQNKVLALNLNLLLHLTGDKGNSRSSMTILRKSQWDCSPGENPLAKLYNYIFKIDCNHGVFHAKKSSWISSAAWYVLLFLSHISLLGFSTFLWDIDYLWFASEK